MWSFRAWRRRRILSRSPYTTQHWQAVRARLPILDGLAEAEEQRLFQRAVLFLHRKRLTSLPGIELDEIDRLTLAAQAELPLLHLADLEQLLAQVTDMAHMLLGMKLGQSPEQHRRRVAQEKERIKT